MSDDELTNSLASWIPPWQRVTAPPAAPETGDDAPEAVDVAPEAADVAPDPANGASEVDADPGDTAADLADVAPEAVDVAPDPSDVAPETVDAALQPTDVIDVEVARTSPEVARDDAEVELEVISAPVERDGADEAQEADEDDGAPFGGEPEPEAEREWQQPETDVLETPREIGEHGDARTHLDIDLDLGTGPENLPAALEAILLVVDEPVADDLLAEVVATPVADVTAALIALAAEYSQAGRGFDLRRAAGGWRLYTRGDYAQYVERFVLDGQSVRLTQAALETLAVIAYQQPVTRSRMSAIRGVNCDGVVRTLTTRGLIEEAGTQPDSGAFLYRTTPLFLEKLGLDSLDELPALAPFLPDDVNGFADA